MGEQQHGTAPTPHAIADVIRTDPSSQNTAAPPPMRLILWFALLVGEAWCAYKVLTQWVHLPITHLRTALELFDFRYYYIAAAALRANLHANIYDPRVVAATAQAHHLLVPPTPLGYPLLLPVVLIPLTVFSYQAAAHIWDLLDIALWAVNSLLLIGWLRFALLGDRHETAPRASLFARIRGYDWSQFPNNLWARWTAIPLETHFAIVVALLISFMSAPMLNSIFLGQVSMLMLTAFLLVPWLVRRGHPLLAGALIMLVTLIKVVPVVLLGYYLLRGRWRVVFGAVATFVVCLVGITALVGIPNILAMRQVVASATTNAAPAFQNQAFMRAPLWIAAAFGGQPSSLTTWLGVLLAALIGLAFVAGVLWFTRRARQNDGWAGAPSGTEHGADSPDGATIHEWLGYAWALCTMILLSPETWEHHDIWLLGPFVLALGYALRQMGASFRNSGRRIKPAVWAVLVLVAGLALTANDLPFGFDGYTAFSVGPYLHGVPLRPLLMLTRPLGALLIWGVVGALFLRSAPAPAIITRRAPRPVAPPVSAAGADASAAVSTVLPGYPAGSVVAATAGSATPGIADGVLLYGLIATLAALLVVQNVIALIAHIAVPH